MPAIRLRDVAKSYGPIQAVDGLNLDVPEGSCVGLLGPNGAGKSTTMKLLTAQAIADRGELEVLGLTLPRASKSARATPARGATHSTSPVTSSSVSTGAASATSRRSSGSAC